MGCLCILVGRRRMQDSETVSPERGEDRISSLVSPEKGVDRISSLPNDLIHKILSFIDAKDAVKTTILSTRWNNLWKTLPILNFKPSVFTPNRDFSKFVEQFLLHQSDLSVSNLNFIDINQSIANKIAKYGALHNLQHLTISEVVGRLIPPSVFTSQSLKHLSLASCSSQVPKSSLVLPALTTLLLERVSFKLCWNYDDDNCKSVDLFSNLLNLKNLTLIDCDTKGLQGFYIVSPQLENLHVTANHQYDGIVPCNFVISAPKLSSFIYKGIDPLLISADDRYFLDRVDMDIYRYKYNHEHKQRVCREIVNMFHQLRDAKFVTLTEQTIDVLSSGLELLEKQQSPFHKIECLKIETRFWTSRITSTLLARVITYLCNSSPSCHVINACGSPYPGQ